MKLHQMLKRLLAPALAIAALGAPVAFAATLDFDGSADESAFVLTDARLVSGYCGPSGPKCLALNNIETPTISADTGTFSLVSFWFQLLGRGTSNILYIVSSSGASLALDYATFGKNNGGQIYTLGSLAGFSDITSLTFSSSGGGSVRIDDMVFRTDVAPIPLPASGLLLLGPIALMIGAARRRRTS